MRTDTIVTATLNEFNGVLAKKPPFSDEARKYVLESSLAVLSTSKGLRQMTLGNMIDEEEALSQNPEFRRKFYAGSQKAWVHEDLAAAWIEFCHVVGDGLEGNGEVLVRRGARLYGFAFTDGSWKITGLASTETEPSSEEESDVTPEIMKPINALLADFSNPDWDKLKEWFLPGAGCTLYRPPAAPTAMTMEQSIVRLQNMIKAGANIQEKIHDVEVRSHGDLGFVWAPFVVELDGNPRHTGVNIFTFLKRDGKWVFSGCQDFGKEISKAEPGQV
ncbi:hypothetical protein FDECE_8137 [Fusarium decemcellulare]|nr:hypothetical protein FDECE_8137 [Fusarium decemcellulare]